MEYLENIDWKETTYNGVAERVISSYLGLQGYGTGAPQPPG